MLGWFKALFLNDLTLDVLAYVVTLEWWYLKHSSFELHERVKNPFQWVEDSAGGFNWPVPIFSIYAGVCTMPASLAGKLKWN